MLRAIISVLVAFCTSACGSVIHSTSIGANRQGTAFQVYALPETAISAGFANVKNGPWTVTVSATNRPSRDVHDWYRLYHTEHLLFGDNFTLTVAGGLLTTANNASTPDAVAAIENLGNLIQTIESLTASTSAEPVEAVASYLAEQRRISYSLGYQLWPAQTACSVENHSLSVCTVQIGFATAVFQQECTNPIENLPGNLLAEGTCNDSGRRNETRAIGRVTMNLASTGTFQSLREQIRQSYLTRGGRPTPTSNGIRFRVTAPMEIHSNFACNRISNGFSVSFPSFEAAAAAHCTRLANLEQFAAVNNPVQVVNVVVPGGFYTTDITRNIFGARTTNLTFSEGVLTSVHLEQSATAAAAILLPLTALGFFVADND
ncbi:hypothetical protein [Hyphobacterium sp.]|uniref:hypothetical protein n=1 Tax=Hyphobacterium sp. TaxID=2004662 RepID=UPI003BAB9ECA